MTNRGAAIGTFRRSASIVGIIMFCFFGWAFLSVLPKHISIPLFGLAVVTVILWDNTCDRRV